MATKEGISNQNPSNWGGMTSRAITIKAPDNIDRGIETIATTENPSVVVDWTRWEMVREVLPLKYVEVGDKVPLLDAHQRYSAEDVLGSASEFRTEGINLLCKTYISKSEPGIAQKIAEGHIDSVSIGYMTDKNRTVEIPVDAAVTIDGIDYRNDFTDGLPMVVRTWWQVKELSLVPIGADQAAKFRAEIRSIPEKIMPTEKPEITDKSSDLELQLAQVKAHLDAVNIERAAEKAEREIERTANLKIQQRNSDIVRYNNLRDRAENLRSEGKLTNADFDAMFSLKGDNSDSIELLAQLSKSDPIEFHLEMVAKYAVPVKFGSALAKEPLTDSMSADQQKQLAEADEYLKSKKAG